MLLVLGIGSIRAEYDDLIAFEEQPSTIDIQAQMSSMMNHMYELIMPDYKKIYKKYYSDIEWLEHNYVINREEGNILINTIAIEFQNVIIDKIDNVIDIIAAQTSSNPTNEERQAFKNIMLQIAPLTIMQGLQKNAEIKSSVYQEIIAEQK
jgi:hypothetical protein